MASIRRHPNAPSRWQVRYRDPTGRQRTKSFGRKADAEKWAVLIEAGKLQGEWIDPHLGKTTVREWSERWFATTVHLKPKTRAGYESLLRLKVLPAFGDVPLNRIQPVDVRQWVAGLTTGGLSASRVRQAHQLLRALLSSAVNNGYIGRNPCDGTPLPRVQPKEKRFLDAEQVARLAEAVDPRYEAMIPTLAYGGLRWAEAVGLRRHRCQLLRSRLEIVESLSEVGGELHCVSPKSGKTREVVLPGFVRDKLAAHIAAHTPEREGLVFTSPLGKPLRHSNFRQTVWLPATKAAGLEGLTPHDLRHTCASLLVSVGAHPRAVMAQLGHATIAVTMNVYAHLFPSDQDELAARLDARHQNLARSHVDRMWTGGGQEPIELGG